MEQELYYDSSPYLLLKYAERQGTDNHAEFYALWLLMKIAEDRGIKHFQVFGYSKLMID